MKTIIHCYASCVIICMTLLSGCNSHESAQEARAITEETLSPNTAVADTLTGTLPEISDRKFIRTAEIKFKSKDVVRTTEAIEDLAASYNGYITHTNLTSSIVYTTSAQITADTLLEQTKYVVENTMTVRVPNTHLDSLLRKISQLADFVDYRTISASDVSLQLLENSLKIKRANEAEKRYTQAIDTKGKKLNESMQAEENRLDVQKEADNRTISNMAYMDQVNYSTVKLSFYQKPVVINEKLYMYPETEVYEPGLYTRLSEAFISGWVIFEEVIVFVVRVWAILALGIVAIWAYKKYAPRAL